MRRASALTAPSGNESGRGRSVHASRDSTTTLRCTRDDVARRLEGARCPPQHPARPTAAAAGEDTDNGCFPPSPAHQSTIASDADAKARGGEDATLARSLPRRRFPAPSVAFDDDDDDDESHPDAPPAPPARPHLSPPPSRVIASAFPAAPTARAAPARDGAPATRAASASATTRSSARRRISHVNSTTASAAIAASAALRVGGRPPRFAYAATRVPSAMVARRRAGTRRAVCRRDSKSL